MTPHFSMKSMQNLGTAHRDLQDLAHEVIKYRDHAIVFGWRSNVKQDELFESGYSKLRGGQSKHNHVEDGKPCSLAIDVIPYLDGVGPVTGHIDQVTKLANKWGKPPVVVKQFVYWTYACVWERYLAVADSRGIGLRNGSNWDCDSIPILDQGFQDLGHIELR